MKHGHKSFQIPGSHSQLSVDQCMLDPSSQHSQLSVDQCVLVLAWHSQLSVDQCLLDPGSQHTPALYPSGECLAFIFSISLSRQ